MMIATYLAFQRVFELKQGAWSKGSIGEGLRDGVQDIALHQLFGIGATLINVFEHSSNA